MASFAPQDPSRVTSKKKFSRHARSRSSADMATREEEERHAANSGADDGTADPGTRAGLSTVRCPIVEAIDYFGLEIVSTGTIRDESTFVEDMHTRRVPSWWPQRLPRSSVDQVPTYVDPAPSQPRPEIVRQLARGIVDAALQHPRKYRNEACLRQARGIDALDLNISSSQQHPKRDHSPSSEGSSSEGSSNHGVILYSVLSKSHFISMRNRCRGWPTVGDSK